MKIIEVLHGLLMPITNEESDLVSKFHEGNSIARSDLSPREVQVANGLVNRDVLLRNNQDGRITYSKKTH